MKTAEQRILDERARQIESEGWTEEHDDKHGDGVLDAAARCYLRAATFMDENGEPAPTDPPEEWPWDATWWKPGTDSNRCLEKAGALFMAESARQRRAGNHEEHLTAAARAQLCIQKLDESLNIDAQEEIYAALWEFADAQRTGPHDCHRIEPGPEGEGEVQVPQNTTAAEAACKRIMSAFGLSPVDYGH